MSNPSPTLDLAFKALTTAILLAGRRMNRRTRYVQADRHRARLIRAGQYIKTSTHVRGKALLVNPNDPHRPTVKELRDGTVIGRLNFGGDDDH